MQLGDTTELLQEQPFITVAEPCVGAGAMVLAVAQTLTDQGIDFTERLHVTATDLSLTAVHQAYVQLCLAGIPAVVHHGNTLSLEVFSSWPTTAHVAGGWDLRLAARRGS